MGKNMFAVKRPALSEWIQTLIPLKIVLCYRTEYFVFQKWNIQEELTNI
jgi:hypothetical protein